MAVVDSNEVSAAIRVCQDAGALQELADICRTQAEKLQKPKRGFVVDKPFVQESLHTSGGSAQPPLTGPTSALPHSTSTAEQAEINNALLDEQLEEDRHTDKAEPRVVAVDPDSADAAKTEQPPAAQPKEKSTSKPESEVKPALKEKKTK